MKNFVEQISIKFGDFLLNQLKFGSNCAVEKHTEISVKICISADIQKVKYRPMISVNLYIGRSLFLTKHVADITVCSADYQRNILSKLQNKTNSRILKANLSWTWKKSNSSDAKKFVCFYLSFFALAKLQILKFGFCQIKWVESRINLQLTGNISLKLDSNFKFAFRISR